MNYFNMDSYLIEALGWTLLHSLWQGAAITLGLLAALSLLKGQSSGVRYFACSLALSFQILCFFITLGLMLRLDFYLPVAHNLASPMESTAFVGASNEMHDDQLAQASSSSPIFLKAEATPDLMTQLLANLRSILPQVVIFWMAGTSLMFLWNLGGWIAAQRLKTLATSLNKAWDPVLQRLMDRMHVKNAVLFLQSDLVQSPVVIGAFRPAILFPVSLLTQLPSDQVEALIAHELAHIRRHDYLINLFQVLAETILFFHPATWWISLRLRAERENCCDDLAVEATHNRHAYVQALAAVAESCAVMPVPAASGSSVVTRIKRLVGVRDHSVRQRISSLSALAVMVMVGLIFCPEIIKASSFSAEFAVFSDEGAGEVIVRSLPQVHESAILENSLSAAIESEAQVLVLDLRDLDPKTLSHDDLEKLKGKKVIGIGDGAARLYTMLGLEINSEAGMGGIKGNVQVKANGLMKEAHFKDLVIAGQQRQGVYLPQIQRSMVDVIALWKDKPDQAAVVRQGNYLLIGYAYSQNFETVEGKEFFRQLATAMLAKKTEPFSVAGEEIVTAGTYSFELGKEVKLFRFKFKKPTRFVATLDQGSKLVEAVFYGIDDLQSVRHVDRAGSREGGAIQLKEKITEDDIQKMGDNDWLLRFTNYNKNADSIPNHCAFHIQFLPDDLTASTSTPTIAPLSEGAFGFPQKQAKVVFNTEDLRVSAWNDASYLYVQAVVWKDNDSSPGETYDGRKIGDNSVLSLDLDGDGEKSANDREYLLNPWPALPGLRYAIMLSKNSSTTVKSDTEGRGGIRYIVTPEGKKVRVDLYLIPLKEISKKVKDSIRFLYTAESPHPLLKVDSFEYQEYTLVENSPMDSESVPNDRTDPSLAVSTPHHLDSQPAVGSLAREVTAQDWLNSADVPSLSGLKGHVVLVEFWATWCGPCCAAIPHLNELQKTYTDQGFRILAFTQQSKKGIENFMKTTPLSYTVGTEAESVFDHYGIVGIPQAFLVDGVGKIVWKGNSGDKALDAALQAALVKK